MVPKPSNTQQTADDRPVRRPAEPAREESKDAAVRIAREEEKRRLEEREPRGLLHRLAGWIRFGRRAQ